MQVYAFDVVVVGSGFGGAVTAFRAAEAGLSVCVLERGRAYPPGSFARAPHQMRDNFWEPARNLHGLFHVWRMDGIDALTASGLGGGSLIYANVLLRKDRSWFEDEGTPWPVSYDDLVPHYERVERMIGVARYPEHLVALTPKTREYRDAAKRLGLAHDLPPLAVSFCAPDEPAGEPIKNAPPHLHGTHTRSTCRLCGECDLGCNWGAKNTLDFNYLSRAAEHGADLRTHAEVRAFSKVDDHFAVDYVDYSDRSVQRRVTLTCKQLVLAAGALGSTFLLLKNREAFPALSPRLGTGFSGNGDFLGLALNATAQTGQPRLIDPGRGPVITSFVRKPDALDGATGRGFYVEDAGYPDFVGWMCEMARIPSVAARVFAYARRITAKALGRDGDTNLGKELSDLIGDCALSKSSLPMLGMGRDVPGGRFFLNRSGALDLQWPADKSSDFFDDMKRVMAALARELGADFVPNPLSTWLRRLVTVHPLGGLPMGRTAQAGVTNPHGEVFGAPGLFVADGAVMPGPVGPNPSLTIAALADRFADRLIDRAGGPS